MAAQPGIGGGSTNGGLNTIETQAEKVSEIPSGAPTRTLEKGLFLLGLFDVDHPEWSLKELRERAGLPKATTRRLMKTLEAANWVAYDQDSGKYHLGSSALRALYLAMSHSELVRTAHPFLIKLTEETTESTSLCVWADRGAMIIDTVPTPRAFKIVTFAGMLLQGAASADAQVLIAYGPKHIRDMILATPQPRRTPHTIVEPERLRERWEQVRRDGVAFDRAEWNEEAPAVAAPVFDSNGELRASISVVAPPERCSEEQLQGYAAAVKRVAAQVSAALGYRAV
jgi:DNA-binding IclR family transcriptional regulator